MEGLKTLRNEEPLLGEVVRFNVGKAGEPIKRWYFGAYRYDRFVPSRRLGIFHR